MEMTHTVIIATGSLLKMGNKMSPKDIFAGGCLVQVVVMSIVAFVLYSAITWTAERLEGTKVDENVSGFVDEWFGQDPDSTMVEVSDHEDD